MAQIQIEFLSSFDASRAPPGASPAQINRIERAKFRLHRLMEVLDGQAVSDAIFETSHLEEDAHVRESYPPRSFGAFFGGIEEYEFMGDSIVGRYDCVGLGCCCVFYILRRPTIRLGLGTVWDGTGYSSWHPSDETIDREMAELRLFPAR